MVLTGKRKIVGVLFGSGLCGKAWFCFRLVKFELALGYSDGDVK